MEYLILPFPVEKALWMLANERRSSDDLAVVGCSLPFAESMSKPLAPTLAEAPPAKIETTRGPNKAINDAAHTDG
ncbi:MAG TPA: hypothetical protein PKW76_05225 [bacterium]|nr:hypothetical protein [bacterium]HPG45063.1 hypothetical protein [bacterium]HPM97305.1 hypothetical protein [bacterium]